MCQWPRSPSRGEVWSHAFSGAGAFERPQSGHGLPEQGERLWQSRACQAVGLAGEGSDHELVRDPGGVGRADRKAVALEHDPRARGPLVGDDLAQPAASARPLPLHERDRGWLR